jgi:hypothetical protein
MTTPLIVSFYTKNTFYEREANNLIESCKKQGLEYAIVGLESLGNWKANCGLKPKFLLDQFLKHQRPLLWVDADAVILEPLTYFNTCVADISFRIDDIRGIESPHRMISSTVFINKTEAAFDFLNHWAAYQKTHPDFTDQETLRDVVYLRFHHLSIKSLPKRYCAIAQASHFIDQENPAIVQYQASRTYQNLIDNGTESLSLIDALSDDLIRESRNYLIYENGSPQDVFKWLSQFEHLKSKEKE